MKFINREFSLFILMGGINTLLGYAIYALFLLFLPYTISYTLSYGLGIFIAYYLNSRFVFKTKFSLAKAAQYPLVYVFQYIAGVLILRLLVGVFAIHVLIAPIIVVGFTIPLTFFLSRFILKERSRFY